MKPFKNITVFTFTGEAPSPDVLRAHKLIDIPIGVSESCGFISADDRSFVFGVNEKDVPASAVKKEVALRVEGIEQTFSEKMTAEDKKRIKSEVIAELTDQALTKTTEVQGYCDGNHLIINSPSVKLCEKVCDNIRMAISSENLKREGILFFFSGEDDGSIFPCRPFTSGKITGALTDLARRYSTPEEFILNQDFFLYSQDAPATKVRFVSYGKDEHVQSQLDNGMVAHAVGLSLGDRLDFTLTEDMQIKAIKFKEVCFDHHLGDYDSEEEAKAAEDDADWIIMKQEFKRLIDVLERNFIKGEGSE